MTRLVEYVAQRFLDQAEDCLKAYTKETDPFRQRTLLLTAKELRLKVRELLTNDTLWKDDS